MRSWHNECTVKMPRSSNEYENDRAAGMDEMEPLISLLILALLLLLLFAISSFELVSPATLASIPKASEGFCKFEKGSSSAFEESDRDVSSPYCPCCPGSCDHVVPRLPRVWKLPSGAFTVNDGSGCWTCACGLFASSMRFFRTRRPPRLLPPRTHSRLSRLHRRHGIELSESLNVVVRL